MICNVIYVILYMIKLIMNLIMIIKMIEISLIINYYIYISLSLFKKNN